MGCVRGYSVRWAGQGEVEVADLGVGEDWKGEEEGENEGKDI